MLERFAKVLASQCRDIDVVARVGGEEFVVLLPGSDTAQADAFTQRVRRVLGSSESAELPSVRVSAGVAMAFPLSDIEQVLRSADAALYAAKRGGRNQTVISEAPSLIPLR